MLGKIEQGLTELIQLAKQHAETMIEHPNLVKTGHHYSNGKIGKLWSIRPIIDSGAKTKAKEEIERWIKAKNITPS